MRVPDGAPVSGWLYWRQKFPILKKASKPSIGTVGVISTICLTVFAVYAVAVQPKVNHEYYKKSQEEKRAMLHANKEQLAQGMRPWSDPFERK